MNESSLFNWISALSKENEKTSNRAAVVISGDFLFCENTVESFIDFLSYESVICISSDLKSSVSAQKSRMLLGSEYDALVFDARHEFDIDAFGVTSGTVKAGGILFLLVASKEDSLTYLDNSRFFNRALNSKNNHSNIYFIKENTALPEIKYYKSIVNSIVEVNPPFRTQDQQQAVQIIVDRALMNKQAVIVLTSDRGRGKSSSLGIAAGVISQESNSKIIITAPRLSSVDAVFHHAKEISPKNKWGTKNSNINDSCIEFMPPDALLEKKPSADIIFVDEASAIPVTMLEKILDAFPLIVFASTVHGYEGTGRGFAIKFNKILDEKKPGWIKIEMDDPIRWRKNDPLEKWVGHMLCLNTELNRFSEAEKINKENTTIERVDRDELLANEEKLKSLFALLIYAHYRTQPSDLVYMLDNNLIRIYTLEFNNKILAVILINEEGGFGEKLCAEIYKGKRRPQGNLLAQTLNFHAGIEDAAALKYARVMRIAVHPDLQRQGLGSYLLQHVINKEKTLGMDAIGSSFGATVELLNFWKKLNFEIVRTGFTQDHVSGTHSMVLLKPFSQQGKKIFWGARYKYGSYIKAWLSGPLVNLPTDMKFYLEGEVIDNGDELTKYEWQDIKSFVNTHRGYESCMSALIKLIKIYDNKISDLDECQKVIVNTKIKQLKSWADVVKQSGVTGKKQAVEYLKLAVKNIIT